MTRQNHYIHKHLYIFIIDRQKLKALSSELVCIPIEGHKLYATENYCKFQIIC